MTSQTRTLVSSLQLTSTSTTAGQTGTATPTGTAQNGGNGDGSAENLPRLLIVTQRYGLRDCARNIGCLETLVAIP